MTDVAVETRSVIPSASAPLVAVILPPREGFGPGRTGAIGLIARRLAAVPGFRTVVVDWDMPDAVADAGAEALSALFDELLERITGLVQSLHGTVGHLGSPN